MKRAALPLALLAAAASVSGQILVNGNFESPGISGPYVAAFSAGVDTGVVVGWAFSAAGTPTTTSVLVKSDWFGLVTFEGQQFVALSAGDTPPNGRLEQRFGTTPGVAYLVTYAVGRGGTGGGTVGLQGEVLSATGTVLDSVQSYPTATGWLPLSSLAFVATTSQTTLRFSDVSAVTDGVDVALDRVLVVPVPEPGQTGMALATALLGTAAWYRRARL
jgi:hypothetical protein